MKVTKEPDLNIVAVNELATAKVITNGSFEKLSTIDLESLSKNDSCEGKLSINV